MSVRKIYSCDWCGVDSDVPNHVGNDWKQVEGQDWLCGACWFARAQAIGQAKADRWNQGNPSEPK